MKDKKLDAVQLMRDIRNKLSKSYYNDRKKLYKDMQKIREKYKLKMKKGSGNI